MKLYMGAESGNSWKIRILLEQLGVPYEKELIDLLTWEHKSKEFMATVNPRGQVPVLEDGVAAFGIRGPASSISRANSIVLIGCRSSRRPWRKCCNGCSWRRPKSSSDCNIRDAA